MKLGATRVVRKHWRAGAMKFLAEIMVERESLDQLDREERGIEDEVKLEEREREGEVWERERERERERGSRRKGGRKKERKDQSIVSQRFGSAARSDRAEYRIGPAVDLITSTTLLLLLLLRNTIHYYDCRH